MWKCPGSGPWWTNVLSWIPSLHNFHYCPSLAFLYKLPEHYGRLEFFKICYGLFTFHLAFRSVLYAADLYSKGVHIRDRIRTWSDSIYKIFPLLIYDGEHFYTPLNKRVSSPLTAHINIMLGKVKKSFLSAVSRKVFSPSSNVSTKKSCQ